MLEFIIPYLSYLPLLIAGSIIGGISIFFYTKIKKTAFVLIGIGFILLVIPNVVYVVLGGANLPLILSERGLSTMEIGRFLFILGLTNLAFQALFALLVLAGLVLLGRETSSSATENN